DVWLYGCRFLMHGNHVGPPSETCGDSWPDPMAILGLPGGRVGSVLPRHLSRMQSPQQTVVPIARAQWLVLVAASLAWRFAGFEMGLFPLIARPALKDLLPGANDAAISAWNGRITACFLCGAAGGGLVFGWLGDRIGRVRAMASSILCYSLFTG